MRRRIDESVDTAEAIKYVSTAKASTGKRAMLKYLRGEQIGMAEAMLGKCFDCMGHYHDGKMDCEQPHCSLYQWMPYRRNR